MNDPKHPSNRLWKVAYILNAYVILIACSMSYGLMLGLWQCVLGNFLIVFPFFAFIALWISYILQKGGKMATAVIIANIPILGHLLYVVINVIHPDGCGVWFMIGQGE